MVFEFERVWCSKGNNRAKFDPFCLSRERVPVEGLAALNMAAFAFPCLVVDCQKGGRIRRRRLEGWGGLCGVDQRGRHGASLCCLFPERWKWGGPLR
jgi:hypothetical protein